MANFFPWKGQAPPMNVVVTPGADVVPIYRTVTDSYGNNYQGGEKISQEFLYDPHQQETRKWKTQYNPIRHESQLRNMRPTDNVRAGLKAMVIAQETHKTPVGVEPNALFPADVLPDETKKILQKQNVKHIYRSAEKKADEIFANDFRGWLTKRGRKVDHQRSGWWSVKNEKDDEPGAFMKQPGFLSKHPTVTDYVNGFLYAKADFMADVAKLEAEAWYGVDDWPLEKLWLYYKYVVRGCRDMAEIEEDMMLMNTMYAPHPKLVENLRDPSSSIPAPPKDPPPPPTGNNNGGSDRVPRRNPSSAPAPPQPDTSSSSAPPGSGPPPGMSIPPPPPLEFMLQDQATEEKKKEDEEKAKKEKEAKKEAKQKRKNEEAAREAARHAEHQRALAAVESEREAKRQAEREAAEAKERDRQAREAHEALRAKSKEELEALRQQKDKEREDLLKRQKALQKEAEMQKQKQKSFLDARSRQLQETERAKRSAEEMSLYHERRAAELEGYLAKREAEHRVELEKMQSMAQELATRENVSQQHLQAYAQALTSAHEEMQRKDAETIALRNQALRDEAERGALQAELEAQRAETATKLAHARENLLDRRQAQAQVEAEKQQLEAAYTAAAQQAQTIIDAFMAREADLVATLNVTEQERMTAMINNQTLLNAYVEQLAQGNLLQQELNVNKTQAQALHRAMETFKSALTQSIPENLQPLFLGDAPLQTENKWDTLQGYLAEAGIEPGQAGQIMVNTLNHRVASLLSTMHQEDIVDEMMLRAASDQYFDSVINNPKTQAFIADTKKFMDFKIDTLDRLVNHPDAPDQVASHATTWLAQNTGIARQTGDGGPELASLVTEEAQSLLVDIQNEARRLAQRGEVPTNASIERLLVGHGFISEVFNSSEPVSRGLWDTLSGLQELLVNEFEQAQSVGLAHDYSNTGAARMLQNVSTHKTNPELQRRVGPVRRRRRGQPEHGEE